MKGLRGRIAQQRVMKYKKCRVSDAALCTAGAAVVVVVDSE